MSFSCESVARYVRTGEFGLWTETGGINEAAKTAVCGGIGLGEAIGREIVEKNFRHGETSVLAAGYLTGWIAFASRASCLRAPASDSLHGRNAGNSIASALPSRRTVLEERSRSSG